MQSLDVSDGTLRLGKKIPNPYSLKVVQQAYNELAEQSGLRSCETIAPTHLYLKFAPKNLEELRLLESDTTLYFYNYPLDVELIGEGGGYHDPSLPDSVPTYQYVCVPIDHPLPEVEYEVLDEIYYEEDDEAELRSGRAISWEQLEEKAYLLAGDSSIISTPETRGSQWRASGYLYYYDNDKYIKEPLVGVPVRMRYHLITYQNCTDQNGYFKSEKKRRGDCKYSIEWKRDAFRIRPNTGWSTADYVIQENTSSVNKTFYPDVNIYQWYYATIFRGAHHYFYEYIYGLPRPENNMEIRASNQGNQLGKASIGKSTEIHIYRNNRHSQSITETVFHELTHSAHYDNTSLSFYTKTDTIIKDSWACAVAYVMTVDMYGSNSRGYDHKQYTGLMIDLMDDDITFAKESIIGDYVKGYTLSGLWKVVKTFNSVKGFKANVINTFSNDKKQDLVDLFDHWGW
ncbi:MAG: hypothetical protein IKV67_00010 [Paludibacteraceae bacterium]|nr:hypothetical protein [Paludibacteraceae bacterium]